MKVASLLRRDFLRVPPFDAVAAHSEELANRRYLVVQNGDRFVGLVTPSDLLLHPHTLLADCLSEKPHVDLEARVEDALALMREYGLEVVPVMSEGHFQGVITQHDVIQAFEKALSTTRAASAEGSADEMVADSLAGVGHDFNNILLCLFGHLQEIASEIDQNPDVAESIRHLESGLLKARDVARHLQSFAQGHTSDKPPRNLKQAILDNVAFFARGSAVLVEFDLGDRIAPTSLPAGCLSRIIGNLVMNARRAMAGVGTLKVEARITANATAATSDSNPRPVTVLTISDNGPGMDDATCARVFERSFSSKGATGGLGLSIVRSLITAHGGTVSVDSIEGQGTTFTLQLPPVVPPN